MQQKKKVHPEEKSSLHPRNKNRKRYDLMQLMEAYPGLGTFIKVNKYNNESIDFADAEAVMALNKAILKFHYGIDYWEIPSNYLCPPIPGRADYIHHIADLLSHSNAGTIPTGNAIKCFDIGVGANCIYPIIGNIEYGWSFVGSEIDPVAIKSARNIVKANASLQADFSFRLQKNTRDILQGVLNKNEPVDVVICNPPFHASAEEAEAGTMRKLKNLSDEKVLKADLNFGGQSNELIYKGGEKKFAQRMIHQSKIYSESCFWFSILISKKSNLQTVEYTLKKVETAEVKIIPMGQGNKQSRIVAWTFLSKEAQQKWIQARWQNK